MDLARLLHRTLADDPGRPALSTCLTSGVPRCFSRAEVEETSCRLARALIELGLTPGDRLALLLPNVPELLFFYLACFKARLIAVPINALYTTPQINYVLRHSGCRAIALHARQLPDLDRWADREQLEQIVVVGAPSPDRPPGRNGGKGVMSFDHLLGQAPPAGPLPSDEQDSLALLVYTSGTTSRPKGVAHSQQRIARRVELFVQEAGITDREIALVAIQLARPLALVAQALCTLYAGGQVVLLEHYTPETFWAAYSRPPAPTLVVTSPSIVADLLALPQAHAVDHAALRLWITGGDRVPRAIHDLFRSVVGKDLVEMCGMTETGFYAMNPPDRLRIGTIGQAMQGVMVRLVDAAGEDVSCGATGEILLRTPDMMHGYWNDTLQTFRVLRDGWLSTGDLARCDENGYLWLVGRTKEMITCCGFKVAPASVEEALQAYPAIAEAVVVGTGDSLRGEAVHAFVRARPGLPLPTPEELRRWLGERIEALAVPEAFTWVEVWPRTAAGKLDRERLRLMAEAGTTDL